MMGDSSNVDMALQRLQQLLPTLQEICKISGTAGASIGILHHGKVLYKNHIGFRDVAKKSVADSQTLYCIGSLTKAFLASGIGRLVSDGKLSWTTPVKSIVPQFQHFDSSLTDLTTVVDLLAHRTGLSGDISLTFQGDGDALLPRDQLLPTLNNMTQGTPFRSQWSYNSWGYSLADLVVQRLSGETVHQYLKSVIYDPLGMESTTTQLEVNPGDNVAEPYSSLEDSTPYALGKRMEFKDTLFEGAAGAYSNIDDMLRWSEAVLKAGHSSAEPEPHETSPLAEVPTILSSQIPLMGPSYLERSYALGWIRTQLPSVVGVIGDNIDILGGLDKLPELGRGSPSMLCIYHMGSTVGYHSVIYLFPQSQSAVVVLTNSIALSDSADNIAQAVIQTLFNFTEPVDFVEISEKVRSQLLEQYRDMASTIDSQRESDGPKRPLSKYTGQYWNPLGNFKLEITQDDKQSPMLQLSFQGLKSQVYDLRPLFDDTFEWGMTLNEEARRGRYHITDAQYFMISFFGDDDNISELRWRDDLVFFKRG